jgi:hypothetical protein
LDYGHLPGHYASGIRGQATENAPRAGWAEVNASVTRATGKSLVTFIADFAEIIVKAR